MFMANIKLIFKGTEVSVTQDTSMEMYANSNNEIIIKIIEPYFPIRFICLDKSTAVKLSKELRKEIALI